LNPRQEGPSAEDGGSSLAGRVSAQLEAMVLSRELKAGARLNENALAVRFGISRSAFREAVRHLEATGLIELIPNRGAFVRRPGLADALDMYEIRAGLARTAGRLLAGRVTTGQLQELLVHHHELEAACRNQELEKYHVLNLKFHQSLARFTGSPRLQRMDESIAKELKLFMWRGVFTAGSARRSCFEHGQLLAAIERGDVEGAGAAFEQHILEGRQRMLESVAVFGAVVEGSGS